MRKNSFCPPSLLAYWNFFTFFSDLKTVFSFYHFHNYISNHSSVLLPFFRFRPFPRTFFVICDLKKHNPLGDLISLFQRFIILSKHNFTFLFQCWYAGVTCVWVRRGITDHRPCHCEITRLLRNYSFEWLGNYLSDIKEIDKTSITSSQTFSKSSLSSSSEINQSESNKR